MLLADKLGLRGWKSSAPTCRPNGGFSAPALTLERARNVPKPYLKQYCLKGEGKYDGYLLIDKPLRARVHFRGRI